LRGNHRNNIFFRPVDRKWLDHIAAEALTHVGARLHAYCWMTNHIHLFVQVGDQPLGHLMQRIGSRYARLIQKGLNTTGHLFERRYHALLVDADEYFLELLRYIHLNPVRAGVVSSPREYRWSSHRTYLGLRTQSWLTTDFALSLFSKERSAAIGAYEEFIDERVGSPQDQSLLDAHPQEPRILGDDRFIERLPIPHRHHASKLTLERLAAAVCAEFGTSLDEVRSPAQYRALSKVRGIIASRAHAARVATFSEIARFLNRSISSMTRSAARHSE
jgi:REP element-mobilizing transposase RayT